MISSESYRGEIAGVPQWTVGACCDVQERSMVPVTPHGRAASWPELDSDHVCLHKVTGWQYSADQDI